MFRTVTAMFQLLRLIGAGEHGIRLRTLLSRDLRQVVYGFIRMLIPLSQALLRIHEACQINPHDYLA
jgi:hypothetical protein